MRQYLLRVESYREFDEASPCDPELLDRSISGLEDILDSTRSSDADARDILARLYVLKYREQAYSSLVSEDTSSAVEKDVFWKMTSPLLLNRRAHELKLSLIHI